MSDKTVSVRLDAAVAGYQAKLAQASKSTREFGRDVLDVSARNEQAFNRLGTAAVVGGAAVLAGFGGAASAAIGWESAFAGVRKTVEGTPEQLQAINDGLRNMSRRLPTSRTELAGIAEAAGQLGIQTPNVLGFTRVMADLGETTNLSATDAAKSLARLANITSMPQDQFDRLGSTVVALGNNLATTESEIVAMSLRLAGAGRQIGLTEAQTLSYAAALSSVGVEAEAGGTAMSRTMVEINKAVASGSDELEVFANAAGMSASEFSAAWKRDAAGTLNEFIGGVGRLSDAGVNVDQVLTDLGLDGLRVADAIKRLSGNQNLLSDALDIGTTAWTSNTALTREANLRYETTEARLKMALNAATDLAVGLGTNLLPAINTSITVAQAMADVMGSVLGAFDALPGPVKSVSLGLGVASAMVLTLGGGLLLLLPRVAATRAALASLRAQQAAGELGKMGSAATFAAGNVGRLAKAASIAGVAVSIGAVALDLWNRRKNESKRRTEDFIEALQRDTDELGLNTAALGENGRAQLLKHLQDRNQIDDLNRLSEALGDNVDVFELWATAVNGSETAQRRIRRAMIDTGEVTLKLGSVNEDTAAEITAAWIRGEGSLERIAQAHGVYHSVAVRGNRGIADSLDELTNARTRQISEVDAEIEAGARDADGKIKLTNAASDAADATDDAAAAAGQLGRTLDQTGQSADGAADDILDFGAAVSSATSVLWGTQQAELAVADAVARVDEAMQDQTESTGGSAKSAADLASELRRLEDAERAIVDAEEARVDTQDAILAAEQARADAVDAVRRAEENLQRVQNGEGEDTDDALAAKRDAEEAALNQRSAELDLADAQKRVTEAEKDLTEAIEEHGETSEEAASAAEDLERAQIAVDRAGFRLTDTTQNLTDAQKLYDEIVNGATTSSERLTEAQETLADAESDAASAAEDVTAAHEDLADAEREVEDRTWALEQAQRQANEQARGGAGATKSLTEMQRDLDQALIDSTGSIAGTVLEMLGLEGVTDRTAKNTKDYLDALRDVRDDLEPGSALQQNLDALIDQLERDFALDVDIDFSEAQTALDRFLRDNDGFVINPELISATANNASAFQGRAGGGPVTAGFPYIVGEKRPEVFFPEVDGMILSAVPNSSPALSPGPGTTITHAPVIQVTGPAPTTADIEDALLFSIATSPF